jgi:hypothetical protein
MESQEAHLYHASLKLYLTPYFIQPGVFFFRIRTKAYWQIHHRAPTAATEIKNVQKINRMQNFIS